MRVRIRLAERNAIGDEQAAVNRHANEIPERRAEAQARTVGPRIIERLVRYAVAGEYAIGDGAN